MDDAEANAAGHTPILEFIQNYYHCTDARAEVLRLAICRAPLSWIGYRFLFSFMQADGEEADEDEDINWFVFSGKCDQLNIACWTSGLFGEGEDGGVIDDGENDASPVVWPLLEEAE